MPGCDLYKCFSSPIFSAHIVLGRLEEQRLSISFFSCGGLVEGGMGISHLPCHRPETARLECLPFVGAVSLWCNACWLGSGKWFPLRASFCSAQQSILGLFQNSYFPLLPARVDFFLIFTMKPGGALGGETQECFLHLRRRIDFQFVSLFSCLEENVMPSSLFTCQTGNLKSVSFFLF